MQECLDVLERRAVPWPIARICSNAELEFGFRAAGQEGVESCLVHVLGKARSPFNADEVVLDAGHHWIVGYSIHACCFEHAV